MRATRGETQAPNGAKVEVDIVNVLVVNLGVKIGDFGHGRCVATYSRNKINKISCSIQSVLSHRLR